jgi:hypothetical protein
MRIRYTDVQTKLTFEVEVLETQVKFYFPPEMMLMRQLELQSIFTEQLKRTPGVVVEEN